MKTLYVSDLDGTLLNSEGRITAKTAAILNDLIGHGLLFSVDTARSLMGVSIINLRDIHFNLPLILMNGALLYDTGADRIVDTRLMNRDTVAAVVKLCREQGKEPLLYRVNGNRVTVSYTNPTCPFEWEFIRERSRGFGPLFQQVREFDCSIPAIYFSTQDTYERLKRIGHALEMLPGIKYVLYQDNYHDNNWYLEVFSDGGGKDQGMLRLKSFVGAGKTVAFGDNFNDLPMLAAADVALVVGNGQEKVQAAADQVIGPNTADGVAEYLQQFAEF